MAPATREFRTEVGGIDRGILYEPLHGVKPDFLIVLLSRDRVLVDAALKTAGKDSNGGEASERNSWRRRRPEPTAASGNEPLPAASQVDVLINLAERCALSCVLPAQHSAQWRLDNCFRDQAVTNARQLADLLSGADAAVVSPGG
jgi:hypothetical protein